MPRKLTLAAVPCPFQLQLLLLHLLLCRDQGEHAQDTRVGPPPCTHRDTAHSPPVLPHTPPGAPCAPTPSQMGQHSSSGCTWRVQLRGWHRMGSQMTVRFWEQQAHGSLKDPSSMGPHSAHPYSPIPGSCRWSTSCRSQAPSGCRVHGAAPRRSRSWGPFSAVPHSCP